MPSAAERQGDLSGLGLDIFDPSGAATLADRRVFEGNRIPTARLSAQAQNLLKQIPLPNIEGTLRDQPNYVGSGTIKFNEDLANTRWDYYLSGKTHVFGRYSLADYRMDSPGIFGETVGGRGFDEVAPFAGVSRTRNQSIAAGFDHAVSSTLLTDFRFGWFRYKVNVDPGGGNINPATDAGIPGLNIDDFSRGMPAFLLNGYGPGGNTGNQFNFGYALQFARCNCPLRQDERQFQFVNNWTKLQGSHTIKFGADIRHALNLRIPSDRHRAGELQFNAARTQGPTGGGSGAGVVPAWRGERLRALHQQRHRRRETPESMVLLRAGSVEGDAQAHGQLRPALGDLPSADGDRRGQGRLRGRGDRRGAGRRQPGCRPRPQRQRHVQHLFAPRLGIAYRVADNTVMRMGYGRGYDIGIFGSVFGHNVTQNLPVLAIQSLQPPRNFDAVFNLAQGPPALIPARSSTISRSGRTATRCCPTV